MKKKAAPWLQKALTSAVGTTKKTPAARLRQASRIYGKALQSKATYPSFTDSVRRKSQAAVLTPLNKSKAMNALNEIIYRASDEGLDIADEIRGLKDDLTPMRRGVSALYAINRSPLSKKKVVKYIPDFGDPNMTFQDVVDHFRYDKPYILNKGIPLSEYNLKHTQTLLQ